MEHFVCVCKSSIARATVHPLARSCGQEPVSQSDSGVETAGCGPGSELGSSSETGSNRAFRIV